MNTKRKEILTPVLDKLTKGITIECRKDVIISKERLFLLYNRNIITTSAISIHNSIKNCPNFYKLN